MKLNKIFIALIFSLLLVSICLAVGDDWFVEKSRHFIINYQEGIDSDFLYKTINHAEEYYEDITNRLGFKRYDFWLWDKRAKIFIYKDRDAYLKVTGMPSWSGGRAIYEQKIIETFPWSKAFFTKLLAHELGHIIFREAVGQAVKIPLWFEEGVANYQENPDAKMVQQRILIDALSKQSLISLEKLSLVDVRLVQDQKTADLFYAQGESVVRYLIEQYGQYNFVKLCRLLRDYKDFKIALPKAYPRFRSLDDLEKDWKEYMENNFLKR